METEVQGGRQMCGCPLLCENVLLRGEEGQGMNTGREGKMPPEDPP